MNSSSQHSLSRRLDLDRDAFADLPGNTRVRVLCGMVWLTIDGEPDDHLLRRGEELALPAGSKALVQALDAPAQVIVRSAPGRIALVLDVLRHAVRDLQRALALRAHLS
jgi:Protein of unknown function (DUF2917)